MVAGPRFEILHGDALERLAAMEAGTIDGIVTSPPYADQRAYGGSSPDEFAAWITPVLRECLRVMRPDSGGMCDGRGYVR